MKIETSSVLKVRLTDLGKNRSPIDVILEDHKPHHGEIFIKCDGDSWTYYWGAMGGMDNPKTIQEFFCSCDYSYLMGKLTRVSSTIHDFEKLEENLKNTIIKQRMSWDLDRAEARDLWDDVEWCHFRDYEDINLISNEASRILTKLIGDEWWYDIPEKTNPEYQYIRKIVETVKEGLLKLSENLAPV